MLSVSINHVITPWTFLLTPPPNFLSVQLTALGPRWCQPLNWPPHPLLLPTKVLTNTLLLRGSKAFPSSPCFLVLSLMVPFCPPLHPRHHQAMAPHPGLSLPEDVALLCTLLRQDQPTKSIRFGNLVLSTNQQTSIKTEDNLDFFLCFPTSVSNSSLSTDSSAFKLDPESNHCCHRSPGHHYLRP